MVVRNELAFTRRAPRFKYSGSWNAQRSRLAFFAVRFSRFEKSNRTSASSFPQLRHDEYTSDSQWKNEPSDSVLRLFGKCLVRLLPKTILQQFWFRQLGYEAEKPKSIPKFQNSWRTTCHSRIAADLSLPSNLFIWFSRIVSRRVRGTGRIQHLILAATIIPNSIRPTP